METNSTSYCGHRFPPEIISHGVWPYHRFCLSFRDVEDHLAKRGITVTHEAVRQWRRKWSCGGFAILSRLWLGPDYARKLERRQGRLGDIGDLDEVFVKIRGERHYRWLRARAFKDWNAVTAA